MKQPDKFGCACAIGLTLLFSSIISVPAADDALAWPPVTAQTRPWAFWWWMGSAVDKTNITKELHRYHDAGLGGVHIIPIYGAKGFESNYISYLSPKWMEMMGWTVAEAHRLGMGVDMTHRHRLVFRRPDRQRSGRERQRRRENLSTLARAKN